MLEAMKERVYKANSILKNSGLVVLTLGKDAAKTVENVLILEEVAMMAWHTMKLNENNILQQELLNKHYLRKHGKNAYYGQKEK